eukprot:GHVU01213687.1.p3 GENE.GHVU01213687.1~~GHVU01213687.1.p3  ORF type:complete len:102 (+),score=11.88 GHVU01213687.1:933-1238(+)
MTSGKVRHNKELRAHAECTRESASVSQKFIKVQYEDIREVPADKDEILEAFGMHPDKSETVEVVDANNKVVDPRDLEQGAVVFLRRGTSPGSYTSPFNSAE